MAGVRGCEAEQGVLLYYKFVNIADLDAVAAWFSKLCSELELLGRVRIAYDGVNVTVGGSMEALLKHIAAVKGHEFFHDIDFKLSSCTQPVQQRVAAETGFTTLSVRIVKDLITLGLHPSIDSPSLSKAGRHVTADEFHSILLKASPVESLSTSEHVETGDFEYATDNKSRCVLIDARNIYETRIGKFSPPTGVDFYDPSLRQYSELPAWLDANEDALCNKRVMMYCTGGVRCELASAYLRSKGKDFEDVLQVTEVGSQEHHSNDVEGSTTKSAFVINSKSYSLSVQQLSGGIHRYLEAFADGGFFKGKNFVFDHRIAVASGNPAVVGHCLLCKLPFDDYSARIRCSLCRLLVLVCNNCQVAGATTPEPVAYACELCKRNGTVLKGAKPGQPSEGYDTASQKSLAAPRTVPSPLEGQLPKRKLRILCLHGFRQNASGFKGRLSALHKKLKHISEFVFVDAPHELPFLYQQHSENEKSSIEAPTSTGMGRTPFFTEGSLLRGVTKKYAWLISPAEENTQREAFNEISKVTISHFDNGESDMKAGGHSARFCSKAPFNPLQYQCQTEGWDTSWEHLRMVFTELGPFDGLLGFSQGASVAAALCMLGPSSQGNDSVNFNFVMLCSGFPSPVPLHQELMARGAGIACPSLHIFGEQDRQIGHSKSEQLANLFNDDMRKVIEHTYGHIIPTKPQYVEQYVQFLKRFL